MNMVDWQEDDLLGIVVKYASSIEKRCDDEH